MNKTSDRDKMSEELRKYVVEEVMYDLSVLFNNMIQAIKENEDFTYIRKICSAINLLGQKQYVCWEYLDEKFIDFIFETDDIDKILLEFVEKDEGRSVDSVICKCKKDSLMSKYKRIYEQSVESYRNAQYELAIVGFTSVLDGLLMDVSKKTDVSIRKRVNSIMNKLCIQIKLENNEIAFITLAMTFEKAMLIFSQSKSFNEKEPKTLNRHWIMHGRSIREKTKLDCIKVIRMVYGMLLINTMDIEDPPILCD